jgi:putative hydrolase of the HAD superfamily
MLAKAFTMGFKFVAYSDALPVLQEMKARGLKTGLISNVGQEIDSYCEELGFASYLDFKVTSFEVGYDKPRPEIFQLALDKAGIKACDSLFIGDQYDQDIVGARGVGMNPILIDRKNGSAKLDCPVINSLSEVVNYLR